MKLRLQRCRRYSHVAAIAADLEKLEWAGVHEVVKGKSGVHFKGARPGVRYATNLHLRSTIRVLELIAEGELDVGRRQEAGDAIYHFVRRIDWSAYLERGQTFRVKAQTWDSAVTSSLLVMKRARDAVCDTLRDEGGWRPEDPQGYLPDVPLQVVVYRDFVQVYLDTSGESLHKRGYRQIMHRASLNEAAAAGLLMLAGLDQGYGGGGNTTTTTTTALQQQKTICDPMCGSGTLLIEAGLLLRNTAPGLFRREWPFQRWSDFREEEWSQARERARDLERDLDDSSLVLLGNDIHDGALALARADIKEAGLQDLITLQQGSCDRFEPSRKPDIVVSNPPWGQRLDREDEETLQEPWRQLGSFLRRECSEGNAYLLSGEPKATQYLRLAATKKHELTIGGVNCRFLQYNIHRKEDKRCFACGQVGHISRDCPERGPRPGQQRTLISKA